MEFSFLKTTRGSFATRLPVQRNHPITNITILFFVIGCKSERGVELLKSYHKMYPINL